MTQEREDVGAARTGGLPPRPVLRNEVWLVLGLSLLASAAYAVVSILQAPVRGRTVALFGDVDLIHQLLPIGFDLVPVLLVFHLLHRSGEGAADLGFDARRPGRDLAQGAVLFALVGTAGLALYAAAVALGVNRNVVPAPPGDHWWTIPVVVLGSARSALLEEIIVGSYLLRRLDQLGWRPGRALVGAALLRASYHLYQGLGGFLGNFALGLLFGRVYQRRGRVMPLVVAHFLLDVVAGLGWLALRGRVSWLPR